MLAELDRRISISRELCVVRDITETPPGLADLVEARAAVAELIDKVDSALSLGWGDTAARELRAALARCRGGES